MHQDAAELAFRDFVTHDVVNVLVIDDDEGVARSLRRQLQGCNVVTVTSGRQALSLLQGGSQAFHLILCDLMMPEVDGCEVFKAVREVSPALAERMVFMSGGATTPSTQLFLQEMKGRYLPKPFSRAELYRAVMAGARAST